MQTSSLGCHLVEQLVQHRIGSKGTIFNGFVDPGEILVHNPARPDIEVTDLGIAHLADGQTHRPIVGHEPGCRILLGKEIHVGGFGNKGGIAGPRRSKPPAVKNSQQNRGTGMHGCSHDTS